MNERTNKQTNKRVNEGTNERETENGRKINLNMISEYLPDKTGKRDIFYMYKFANKVWKIFNSLQENSI